MKFSLLNAYLQELKCASSCYSQCNTPVRSQESAYTAKTSRLIQRENVPTNQNQQSFLFTEAAATKPPRIFFGVTSEMYIGPCLKFNSGHIMHQTFLGSTDRKKLSRKCKRNYHIYLDSCTNSRQQPSSIKPPNSLSTSTNS